MCKSRNSKMNAIIETKIDKCMDNIITFINHYCDDWKTLACCCGHGVYPMSIVVECKSTGKKMEIFSYEELENIRKFYKKDNEGFYYIPEVNKLNLQGGKNER